MRTYLIRTLVFLLAFAPELALAQLRTSNKTFADLIGEVVGVINIMLPVVAGLVVVTFMWGVARYIFSAESAEKGKGRALIGWGLVAVFVMVSIWGIVTIFKNTLLGS